MHRCVYKARIGNCSNLWKEPLIVHIEENGTSDEYGKKEEKKKEKYCKSTPAILQKYSCNTAEVLGTGGVLSTAG